MSQLFISQKANAKPQPLQVTNLMRSSVPRSKTRPTAQLGFALSLLLSAMFTMQTAQAASCKLPKSYYKHVSCTASRGHFLATKDYGAPVALIDSNGKRVVDLSRYQKADANKISGGLIPVQRNGSIGYVNMQGREVVPAIYDILSESSGWARPVADGRIIVKKGGKYGVIDTANQVIVPFSSAISDIGNYRSGTTRVSKNQAISWLDRNGQTTSDPNASAKSDSEGAQLATDNNELTSSQVRQSPPMGFTTLQPQQQNGKWGFVDEQDVTMITYSFDEVRPFSEGLAGVRVDNKWGFISLGGELVVPFRFDSDAVIGKDKYKGVPAFVFKEGKAWIGSLKNGAKMCINKEGTNVNCD